MSFLEVASGPLMFAFAATISPGGATTLATASGAQFGLRRSVPLICGIAVGLATLAGASAAGLGAVLHTVPGAQHILAAAGSLYLAFLAVRIAGNGSPESRGGISDPIGWMSGVGLLWLNPKGWAMTLGAAASFAGTSAGPLSLALILALVFAGASTLSLTLWCTAGTFLARLLTSQIRWRRFNILLAGLLLTSIVPLRI